MTSYTIESLISYGEKVQYGQIPKNEKELLKNKKGADGEDQDPIRLKSYLDTILPPKESTQDGQIYMQFVSCTPATTSVVLKLNQNLEIQMKARGARETGICNIREELFSECFDELIRQITINCLQRGELLNHIKEQMKETINYYQKLYDSSMAFAMRKVLREKKKRKELESRQHTLEMEIDNLKKIIKEKEREIEETIKNDDEHEKVSLEDHEDLVKNLKYDNNQKAEKLKEILTTPKQIIVSKK